MGAFSFSLTLPPCIFQGKDLNTLGSFSRGKPSVFKYPWKRGKKGTKNWGKRCVPGNDDGSTEITGKKEEDETVERRVGTAFSFLFP